MSLFATTAHDLRPVKTDQLRRLPPRRRCASAHPLSVSQPCGPGLCRDAESFPFLFSSQTVTTTHDYSNSPSRTIMTTLSDEPQIIHYLDTTRPMSIDLSLELERQLEAESLPNSPNPPRPQSLDVNVLVNLVTQLRLSLAETTRERDTLAEKFAEAQTREEGMRETLEHVTDKCIRMENELEIASGKQKDSEETITMLRSKLEESRCVGAFELRRSHSLISATFL